MPARNRRPYAVAPSWFLIPLLLVGAGAGEALAWGLLASATCHATARQRRVIRLAWFMLHSKSRANLRQPWRVIHLARELLLSKTRANVRQHIRRAKRGGCSQLPCQPRSQVVTFPELYFSAKPGVFTYPSTHGLTRTIRPRASAGAPRLVLPDPWYSHALPVPLHVLRRSRTPNLTPFLSGAMVGTRLG
jgi:hypothetical protein